MQRWPTGPGVKETGFETPDIPIKKSAGPVQIDSVKFGGMVEFEDPAREDGVSVGGSVTNVEQGVKAEAAKKLKSIAGSGLDVKFKAGGKATTKGVEAGAEVTFEGQSFDHTINFVIIGKEWKSGDVKLAQLKYKLEGLKVDLGSVSLASGPAKAGFKGYGEITLDPDWGRIGTWMAQRFGAAAAGSVALSVGMIAIGASVIVLYVHTMLTKDEIARNVDAARATLDKETAGYKAAMTGEEGGGEMGRSYAKKSTAKADAPAPTLYEKAKERSLDKEAYAKLAPVIRQKAIDAYWKEHWFEKMMYGEQGAGSGGFRTFKRVLDASFSNAAGA